MRERASDSASWNPRNRLLAALPHEVLSSLRPYLEPVSLPRDRVLCDADEPLRRVYFVEAGFVALVTVFEDGTTPEMATVGPEGVVGIAALLGGEHALGRQVVLVPGSTLAIDGYRFQSALRDSPELRATCDSYVLAFQAHLLQKIACIAAHTVEQRCACWLLRGADQAEHGTFELTLENLAEVLGVSRSTVAGIADMLKKAGLIGYHRDVITVLDRPAPDRARRVREIPGARRRSTPRCPGEGAGGANDAWSSAGPGNSFEMATPG